MTLDLLDLPENNIRICIWGPTYDDVLYDRVFIEPPTINQLKEMRDIAARSMEEQEDDAAGSV